LNTDTAAARSYRRATIAIAIFVLALPLFAWGTVAYQRASAKAAREQAIEELRAEVSLSAADAVLRTEDRTTGFRRDQYFEVQLTVASYALMERRASPAAATASGTAQWPWRVPADALVIPGNEQTIVLCPGTHLAYVRLY
jgi:hypothetical protein